MTHTITQSEGRRTKERAQKSIVTYLAVDNSLGEVELADHAEWDGTTARFGIVQLALKQDGVDSLLLGEDLGGAGSRWTSSDDSNLVLHAEST